MKLEQALTDVKQDDTNLLWICEQLGNNEEHLQAATLLQRMLPMDKPAKSHRLALSHHLAQAGLPAHALHPLRELGHWREHRMEALQCEIQLWLMLRQPQRAFALQNELIESGIDCSSAICQQAQLVFSHHAPRKLREHLLRLIGEQASLSRDAGFFMAWHVELEGKTDLARTFYLEQLWDQPDDSSAFVRLSGLMDANTLLQSVTGQRFFNACCPEKLVETLMKISKQVEIDWYKLGDLASRLLAAPGAISETSAWQASLAYDLDHNEQAWQLAQQAMAMAPVDLQLLRQCLSRFWIHRDITQDLQTSLAQQQDQLPELGYGGKLLRTVLCIEAGQIESAEKLCRELCDHYSHFSKPWILHSEILRRMGKSQTALDNLQRCPDYARTEEINLEKSIALLDCCGTSQPLRQLNGLHFLNTTIKALNSRALALYLAEKVDSSESVLRQSLKLHIHNPDAWNLLAIIARERADYLRSLRCLRKAMRQNPNHAPAHYNLSQLHVYTAKSRHLRELKQQLERSDLPHHDRINFLFAYAKAHDDCRQYDESLGIYLAASKLKLAHSENFDLQNHVQFLINRNKAFADYTRKHAEDIDKHTEKASDFQCRNPSNPIPIFIVGLPRCGSTLVEQILGSNRNCKSLGESKLFSEAMQYAEASLDFPPQTVLRTDQIEKVRSFYFNNMPDRAQKANWTTDKMLYNYTYAPLLKEIFPECRIIAMDRKPLDTFLSMIKCNFTEGNLWTYAWDSMLDIYDSYQQYISIVSASLREHVTTLHYECLVQEPEPTIRQLTQWLGMNWNPGFLRHQQQSATIRTASDQRARQAIDRSSLDSWQRHAEALKPIRSRLLALGYK